MAKPVRHRILEIYSTEDGLAPFTQWIDSIKDLRTRVRIRRYVDRIGAGNFGNHKGIGEGVFEMRLFFGAGYSIYFAEDGDTLVILLTGGSKETQPGDIENLHTNLTLLCVPVLCTVTRRADDTSHQGPATVDGCRIHGGGRDA